MIIINAEIIAGSSILQAVEESIDMAKKLGCMVTFSFNGININVTPSSDKEEEINYYHRMNKGA